MQKRILPVSKSFYTKPVFTVRDSGRLVNTFLHDRILALDDSYQYISICIACTKCIVGTLKLFKNKRETLTQVVCSRITHQCCNSSLLHTPKVQNIVLCFTFSELQNSHLPRKSLLSLLLKNHCKNAELSSKLYFKVADENKNIFRDFEFSHGIVKLNFCTYIKQNVCKKRIRIEVY